MEVTRAGAQPSATGSPEWFTGHVRVDPLFQAAPPAHSGAAVVTFEPGARTVWHTHPLGQILFVLSGIGRVQGDDGPVQEIRPGDVVRIGPGERHWHGASPTNAMTHVAITEMLDGQNVEWLEPVTDEQYASVQVSPR